MQKSLDSKQSQVSLFTNNQNLSLNIVTLLILPFLHFLSHITLYCREESTDMRKFVQKSEVE